MPRWEPEQTVTLSLMERLIDQDPKNATENPMTRAQSLRLLKNSLRRDLEWLLNSRQNPEAVGPEYRELERSLFNYGLPDATTMSWTSVADRQKLSRLIQVTLARFEPRISRLKVIPLESAGAARHVLRFQIEGLLDMDPAPEHISFDTVLQLSSGDYQVKGDPSAG
ncbi:MAG: type VI secretion system baseplate subunit TssE [Bryobacteraceae bacterium]|jgi:type VI secretion system protein ImpF